MKLIDTEMEKLTADNECSGFHLFKPNKCSNFFNTAKKIRSNYC